MISAATAGWSWLPLARRYDPLAPDGRRPELLAFFPLADRTNWVAWTPDGFYAATPGAHGVLRWHLNHGWDAPGDAIPVSEIAELRRPEVLPLVLQEMDIVQALGLAELNEARLATQRRLNSAIKPGTQLHVLAVGVGDYNKRRRSTCASSSPTRMPGTSRPRC